MSLEQIFNPDLKQVDEEVSEDKEVVQDSETEEYESETTSQVEEQESEPEVKPEKPAPKAEDSEEDLEKQNWTLAAVKDERRKRQELQKELDAIKSAKQEDSKKALPDVFDDQNAFADGLRQEYRQEISRAKLDIARDMMRDFHDDYEDMETFFLETVAKENPVLAEQAGKSSNPAKAVYESAKKYKEYQKMQDLDAYKAQLKAELKAELQKAESEKSVRQAEKVADIKPSLAKARASADSDKVVKHTLESLFGS